MHQLKGIWESQEGFSSVSTKGVDLIYFSILLPDFAVS